jgi:hypothetical protein
MSSIFLEISEKLYFYTNSHKSPPQNPPQCVADSPIIMASLADPPGALAEKAKFTRIYSWQFDKSSCPFVPERVF